MSTRRGSIFGRFRRRWQRWAALAIGACAAISLMLVQSCSMPGPKASKEQIAAIPRAELPERTGAVAAGNVPALSYLKAGDSQSPRVIYIHGTPGSADGWADFLVSPVAGFEAVAIDRLGFGKSGPHDGRGEPSFAMQAKAVEPLLVQRQGRWPILVGHSLGGPIAAWIAGANPDKVGGLVIVAGSLDPAQEKPGLGQRIATTALVRAILPRALDNSMGELDSAKTQTQLLAPLLSKITCPIIIIHGTTDALVPYDNVAYMQSMFTSAASVKLVTLEKQGHFVPWERPDVIRDAVQELREMHPAQREQP